MTVAPVAGVYRPTSLCSSSGLVDEHHYLGGTNGGPHVPSQLGTDEPSNCQEGHPAVRMLQNRMTSQNQILSTVGAGSHGVGNVSGLAAPRAWSHRVDIQ